MLLKLKGGPGHTTPPTAWTARSATCTCATAQIASTPAPDERIDREYDLSGRVVMAGAIDMHTHIGGGKVNIARAMLPEDHRADPVARTAITRASCGHAAPGTFATGYRYAEMGYTACFEPAMLPVNARQAHLEMGDTPIVDKGGYVMLGSDDFLLRLHGGGRRPEADQRLRRVDPARDALHRHQGGESRRHLRVQVQPAHDAPRRSAPLLRRDAPRHPPGAEPRGARAGRSAPAARARQQPRRAGQRGHHARHHAARRRGCRST